MFEETESSRLSSVTIGGNSITSISDINIGDVNDIESQIDKLKQEKFAVKNTHTQNIQLPKGILKRTSVEQDNDIARKIVIYSVWIIALIICLPIIICDLYFAYTDETCVNEYPSNIDINMKQYLIVSAITSFVIINAYMLLMNSFAKEEYTENFCCVILAFVFIGLLGIFALIWNILGAVVFWGSVYGDGHCSRKVSTYLFVSLIIKFVFTIQSYKSAKKTTE